ncbi:MAG: HDOD domain-containing protein [Phycisphaerales bacterium JB063]
MSNTPPPTTPATDASAAATPTLPPEQIVDSAIREISHIATLPEVTMKIIQLVEDPDSTAQDLNKVISNDPALGARILKVVNSAFYGLPGQIGSINRAIVLLGLNAVKNIAIAASLAKLFRGGKIAENFDARDLWTNAIASATATRLLAQKVSLGLPDEAFLAGLIHDLGIMVEVQAKRAQFVQALELTQSDPTISLRQAETRCIGANHEQFGQALCKLWKFPINFQYVTGFHHRPKELDGNHRALTALVYVADMITKDLGMGLTLGTEHDSIEPALLEELKLTNAMIDEVRNALPAAIDEAKGIFQSPA